MDVDAGPVIAGHGVAANAFGIGAARKNGRFDRAYPLSAEMLATVIELPNGALAIPRLLSNASDAPLLGEAAILWQLSVQPEKGFVIKSGGSIPPYVYIVPGVIFLFGIWRLLSSIERFRATSRPLEELIPAPTIQAILWIAFMLAAIAAFSLHHGLIALLALTIGAMLPATKKKKAPKGTEDWPDAKPSPEPKQGG